MSSDLAERADNRYSVMARSFRAVAADSCWFRSSTLFGAACSDYGVTATFGARQNAPVVSFAVLSGVCDCEGTS